MAGKILVINQGTALMVNRLVSLLKEAEIDSAVVEPVVRKIDSAKGGVDVIVFFTGDYVFDAQDFLIYLGKLCFDTGKPLCLVGYDKELEKVRNSIHKEVPVHEFPRPFDVKNLAAEIVTLLSSDKGNSREKTILLVDDDTTYLRMMQGCLGPKYKVAAASSGVQGIEYLAGHTVDLILLDYDMPVTPGPQILKMLRNEQSTKKIPVIFLTGKNDRESVMKVMSLKPDGYILKSTNQEDILATLHNFFKTKSL
ncbi:MAG: response regulator [Fretibacterium sp.]|nr:response regulator [Fretibacterium sp.]